VHPILHAYLTRGLLSKRLRWSWKYRQNIRIRPDNGYYLTEFHFYDSNNEEIRL